LLILKRAWFAKDNIPAKNGHDKEVPPITFHCPLQTVLNPLHQHSLQNVIAIHTNKYK
jgi:hypothetical protein